MSRDRFSSFSNALFETSKQKCFEKRGRKRKREKYYKYGQVSILHYFKYNSETRTIPNMKTSDYNFKLSYFPFAGRAEPLRWAVNYLNIPFEDELLDFQTFGALKMSGKLQFGQVPVLYVWRKS